MKRTTLLAVLAGCIAFPAMSFANCGSCEKKEACGSPCAAPAPCARKVKCCEKVAICCPVERTHYRLVKSECCVPKTHTKCVKDSCDKCAPPRQITWTTYHHKTNYHWERYTTVENKTRYITRCTDRLETASAGGNGPTVASIQ